MELMEEPVKKEDLHRLLEPLTEREMKIIDEYVKDEQRKEEEENPRFYTTGQICLSILRRRPSSEEKTTPCFVESFPHASTMRNLAYIERNKMISDTLTLDYMYSVIRIAALSGQLQAIFYFKKLSYDFSDSVLVANGFNIYYTLHGSPEISYLTVRWHDMWGDICRQEDSFFNG